MYLNCDFPAAKRVILTASIPIFKNVKNEWKDVFERRHVNWIHYYVNSIQPLRLLYLHGCPFFFLSTLYLANKIEVTLHVNLFFWNHTHAQKKGAHDCNRIEEKKRWEILEWWEKRTKTKESIRWYVYWPFFFFSFESSKKHFAIPFILFFSRTANGFFFVGLFLGSNWQEALQLCWRISPPLSKNKKDEKELETPVMRFETKEWPGASGSCAREGGREREWE